MKSILKAMKNGTLTVVITKQDENFTISIVPKQSELPPITISGDMEEVLFDLDSTDLSKSIGIATDLESVVTDYKAKADAKKEEMAKAAKPTTSSAKATTTTKESTVKPNKTESEDKGEDGEVNAFED